MAHDRAAQVRQYSENAVAKEMENVPSHVPYTITNLIGKGSFGSVFKAVNKETKQLVAIKSLDLDQHDDEIKDIQKEIGLLSQLKAADAPNITAYHGTYQLGSRLWVIMDLCSGGSMRTLMKAGPIDEKYINIVIRETLRALEFLHENGIIHRDIKAANILVGNDGKVALCDFGVSAQMVSKNAKRNTFVGTPQWMAPEALTGGMYDSRIDIWSFGITIIEMAKQNPPLHHVPPHRVVDMIPRMPPPRLEGGSWSNSLREFVALCLNEVPEDRATVEDLCKTKLMRAAKAPTSTMRELLARYEKWEQSGGSRVSLLYPGAGDNGDYEQDDVDPCWDFGTIKSRASGVPKEWDNMARATIKPAPPRAAGRRGEHLYKLFEDPSEASTAAWAPSADSDQTLWAPSSADLDSNFHIGSNTNHHRAPSHDASSNFISISIPSFDDDGMQLPQQYLPMHPDPLPLAPQIMMPDLQSPTQTQIMIPDFQSPTQTQIMIPDFQSPTQTQIMIPDFQSPTQTQIMIPDFQSPTQTQIMMPDLQSPTFGTDLPSNRSRADSIESDIYTDPPAPAPQPQHAQSAPSSPPRHIPIDLLGNPGMTITSRHHVSKSVPTVLSPRRTETEPPLPASSSSSQHSRTRSGLRARGGQRPGMLNLSAGHGVQGATAVQGEGTGVAWPVLAPLDTRVLSAPGSRALQAELDRMLGGMADALEVLEAGLKRLGTQEAVGEEEEG